MQAIDQEWLTAVEIKQGKDLVFTGLQSGYSIPVMIYSTETKQLHKLPIKDRDEDYSKLIFVNDQLFEFSETSLSVLRDLKDPV